MHKTCSIVVAVLLLSAALPLAVAGHQQTVTCSTNLPDQFYLVAGASGSANQSAYSLYFSSTPAPASVDAAQGPSVVPNCGSGTTKSLSFTNATGWTMAYSNSVGGVGFPKMKVNSACSPETMFNIRQNEYFQYVVTSNETECLAIVADTPEVSFKISSCTDKRNVCAEGRLNFIFSPITTPTGNFPYTSSWNISVVNASSAVSNLVILAIAAVKINDAMECIPQN